MGKFRAFGKFQDHGLTRSIDLVLSAHHKCVENHFEDLERAWVEKGITGAPLTCGVQASIRV